MSLKGILTYGKVSQLRILYEISIRKQNFYLFTNIILNIPKEWPHEPEITLKREYVHEKYSHFSFG